MCCSVLQCVAVCCSALQHVAVRCSAFKCVAGCCNVLQCVGACCSVLQCVAVYCSIRNCRRTSELTFYVCAFISDLLEIISSFVIRIRFSSFIRLHSSFIIHSPLFLHFSCAFMFHSPSFFIFHFSFAFIHHPFFICLQFFIRHSPLFFNLFSFTFTFPLNSQKMTFFEFAQKCHFQINFVYACIYKCECELVDERESK